MNPGPSTGSDCRITVAASKRHSENSDTEPPRKHRPEFGAASETDANGMTALHRAAIDGDMERVKVLLERGFDPRAKDLDGRIPLLLALLHEKEAVSEILVDAYRPGDDSGNKLSPLHVSASMGFIGVLRKLVAAGADTLSFDVAGLAPLHHAVIEGMDAAAETLMDAGGASHMTRDGRTPLSIAMEYGRWGIAKKLLLREVNPHIQVAGLYAFQFAVCKRRDDVAKMIVAMYVWKDVFRNLIPKIMDWRKVRLTPGETALLVYSLSECEAELQRMMGTRIHASCVSYYDVVRLPTCRVARYLQNNSVREAVSVDHVMAHFPNYAQLIAFRVQLAEERRVLMEQYEQCFSRLERKLPLTCSHVVLLCLGERDVRNFIAAFEPRKSKFT